MNPGFWKDRRVLVTGHTGFKGSWLCIWLEMVGAKVCGYALEPPTIPSLYELAGVDDLVDSTIGDVGELAGIQSVVAKFEPELIIHMAAQSVVLDSYRDPLQTYATNVIGTANLLEAIRLAQQECAIVNVTTDKCYENTGLLVPYREDSRLGGRDPYSNSKACAELVAAAYRESFFPAEKFSEHGVSVSCARAGNVIGGGDWTPWQLIPDVIVAIEKGEKVVLRHPDAIRPWQHVLDCLNGYLTLLEKQSAGAPNVTGGWNFGPADCDAKSVAYVVETIAHRWNVKDAWVGDSAEYDHEEPILLLDSTKANEELGWHPRLPIDSAIHWVADWYKSFSNSGDARGLCQRQIHEFHFLDRQKGIR